MNSTNDEAEIELASLPEESFSVDTNIVGDPEQSIPDSDAGGDKEENEALLSMIEGQSLGSQGESGNTKEFPVDEATSPENDETFIEIFTQMAKEKLEGMMGGLLEAMVEQLRCGRSTSELDVEASPCSREDRLRSMFVAIDTSDEAGAVKSIGAESGAADGDFWPFKPTKTDAEIKQEDQEKREYFLSGCGKIWLPKEDILAGHDFHHQQDFFRRLDRVEMATEKECPEFDTIPDVWRHVWTCDSDDREIRHSLAKELAFTIRGTRGWAHSNHWPLPTWNPDCSDGRTLDPFDHGTLFSIICQIGRMVEWSVQILKDQECFSKGQSDLHIIVTRVAIEAIKIIQHNETIDTLLRRCFEKRLLFDPFMCCSRPNIDDLSLVILALDSVSFMGNSYDALTTLENIKGKNKTVQATAAEWAAVRDSYMAMSFNNVQNEKRKGKHFRLPTKEQMAVGKKTEMFRTDDLRLCRLLELGRIQVSWTTDPTDHLHLETYPIGAELRIYWFLPAHEYYLSSVNSNFDYFLEMELNETMDIIFGYNTKSQKAAAKEAYASIQAPYWLYPLHRDMLASPRSSLTLMHARLPQRVPPSIGDYLTMYPPNGVGGTGFHLRYSRGEIPYLDYSRFRIYGDRLRTLRNYMDSVKPEGLRGLLKDDRNSMGFYTFWFAVIFGTTSVILALASLLVSSLQTWAAFHPQNVNGDRPA